MASIRTLYECPHCENQLLDSKRPEKCPACGYSFGEPGDEFKYPVTLSEQLERIKNTKAHYRSILNMPIDKANNIVNDALNILETIPAKKVPTSDISYLIGMAIKIGDIAEKYHEYLAAGGKHVPSLFVKEEGDKDEQPQAGVREDVTRGV